jgi:hypothetical protein
LIVVKEFSSLKLKVCRKCKNTLKGFGANQGAGEERAAPEAGNFYPVVVSF